MATTGIGSGLCEGNVLAMAIEGPGGTDRAGAVSSWARRQARSRRSVVGDIFGYADRVAITIQQTVITPHMSILSITSTALRYIHSLNK